MLPSRPCCCTATGTPRATTSRCYLRQARSLFDGDIGDVIADNRFSVVNSGPVFSPIAYPWGWPLMLAPFVNRWGLDYDRLKLLEVAAFCIWLVLVHGIVRRRAGRLLALAVTAVVATAPAMLVHTDQLLSEYPHAAVVAAFIWWMDRIKVRRPLIGATTRQLVVLGLARRRRLQRSARVGRAGRRDHGRAGRRAGRRSAAGGRRSRCRGAPSPRRTPTFVAAVVGFQLLLPSMLFPDTGDGPRYVPDRLGDYAGVLTEQLGLGRHPLLGTVVLLLAVAGMVVGCIRRPRLDIPLTALTVLSTVAVSTHFRMVGRYYFQVTPWVLYFAGAAIAAAAAARAPPSPAASGACVRRRAAGVPGRRAPGGAARGHRRRSRSSTAPVASRSARPIRGSRRSTTPSRSTPRPTDVVAYFRARTMTLLTDRLTIQTTNMDRILQRADWFAQQRNSSYYQPDIDEAEAAELGLEEVWSDSRWILWRVPESADVQD